jgi:glycosyltransferase involved in cell wall biosynthesis
VKKRTGAKFYLILRDIHPQSYHSLGCFRKFPVVYWYFYLKAQKAYKRADYIGCMSPGNIDYVHSIARGIEKSKVVLLPNWQKCQTIAPANHSVREKYRLQDKFVAIYGGNLAIGQGVENIIALAKRYIDSKDIVFLVVGKGIRKQFMMDEEKRNNLTNLLFLDFMPREEYNHLLRSADVGIISLNGKYTVPTCPSRIIGYMAMKIPVIAIINKGSDYGQYYIDNTGCGFWTDDVNDAQFHAAFDLLRRDKDYRMRRGESGYEYYLNHLTPGHICSSILDQIHESAGCF